MTIIREFIWAGFVGLSAITCIFFVTFGHGVLTKAKAARLKSVGFERVFDRPTQTHAGWTLRESR
jgi:choline-glycine betaine transporter